MHRPTVGWIALVLLVAAVVLWAWFPADPYLFQACLRPAIVMGLIWLAMPQLRELPRWMMIAVLLAGLVVLWRPKFLLFALPVLAAMWLLRPRRARR